MESDSVVKIRDNVLKKGTDSTVLIIELYYGGSHKELIDNICKSLITYTLVTLPAKKWHWRSRCGALCLLNIIPEITTEKVLFCSSVLNLAELIGLRADLRNLKKVMYFHENQLIYPIQDIKQRDVQYPYNQITSCLAADIILFNSHFNKDSFINNIKKVMKLIPDHRPKNLEETIKKKSSVLYFPILFPDQVLSTNMENEKMLKVVWPHRWEFDKGPDEFFNVMLQLKAENFNFKLAILGDSCNEIPDVITLAKNELKDNIFHCGYLESKEDYYGVLRNCDLVVSTSRHEFFGVAMLEAVYCGCFPLVPNSLVYPEIYPKICLYTDVNNLCERLKYYCQFPNLCRQERQQLNLDFQQYSVQKLVPQFMRILSNERV